MQMKYLASLFMVFIMLMVACTGSAIAANQGIPALADNSPGMSGAGQFSATDGNAYGYRLAIDNNIVAYEVNTESRAYKTPYVSRARDQVRQNENRNTILQFIRDNPGATSYDISRSLGINLGTVRYHLMILDVNHLVAAYHDGAKRIRYFTNNGSFSQDQMKIISLLKREPTNRLLSALAGKNGLSNAQITVESGLSYSDVNRYLKELMAKGVVVRESIGMDKYIYRIAPCLELQIKADLGLK